MVDVCSSSKRGPTGPPGESGPPGKKGKDAFELYKWCPSSMLRIFRENEACNFYFNTADDGITQKGWKGIGLKDHLGKRNAICLQNFEKPIQVEDVYALPLKGALYEIRQVQFGLYPSSIDIIALSFKVLPSVNGGYIYSNKSNTRGVIVSKKSIGIVGTSLQLDYQEDWNTLIIQYSCINEKEMKCFYVLNGKKGTFTQKPYAGESDHNLLIGGKGKKYANVLLGNFEVYVKIFKSQAEKSYLLPDEIINLIRRDMETRLDCPLTK